MQETRATIDVDLFAPAAMADPYPLYEQIRAVGNVVWSDQLHGWMVVGYEECNTILTDRGGGFVMLNGDPDKIYWFEAPNIMTLDGDQHRRLRRALGPMFTRGAVATWEERIREVVADLLSPLAQGRDDFDLIADFTMVPTVIVADMLGIPPERYADFRRWSHEIASNIAYGLEDDTARSVLKRASRELNDYLRDEIERHRRERPDDLITALLGFTGDDAMTDDEIRSLGVLLLIAGYDSTAKTMANTLVALERNPEQRRLVVDDLSLVPAAIEESMRWYGAVQWMPRGVVEDVVLDGTEIKAGEIVYVMNAAADRDPRRWDRPEVFDVTRDLKPHLGFGHGPHICLGAPLARLEATAAIEHLLTLAPRYRLRGIDFGNAFVIRGPERGLIDTLSELT